MELGDIMKSSLCALAALLLPAAAFAATTGSATKPIGASDDLTTSNSGAVDSYSGAYTISAGWYEPYKAFDGNLPVDQNSANTKALIASAEILLMTVSAKSLRDRCFILTLLIYLCHKL